MNIYLLTQRENDGYDTFDSMVVCADTEEYAKNMHPFGKDRWGETYPTWASTPDKVDCTLIGVMCEPSTVPHVILSSFNAG